MSFDDPIKVSPGYFSHKVTITTLEPFIFASNLQGVPLDKDSCQLYYDIPKQITDLGMVELAEAMSAGTKVTGVAMLAASVITSSASMFIAIIGFSEILAFLPMINLDYTSNLKVFF